MTTEHITTTVIGSMPKPRWLVPEENIRMWRLSGKVLRDAQDDATLISIQDQEKAGIEVITDGEQRRMYYMSRLISSLSGIDAAHSNLANVSEDTVDDSKPRVVSPIGRAQSFSMDDLAYLKANTNCRVKMTLPGPMTVIKVIQDDYYHDERSFALAIAAVLRQEMLDLQAAGCDVVQLDEAFAIFNPQDFFDWGREALDAAFDGVTATTCVHFCFGYRPATDDPEPREQKILDQFASIMPEIGKCRSKQFAFECTSSGIDINLLGTLPSDKQIVYGAVSNAYTVVEDPIDIAARLRKAREILGPDRLWAAPDCGLVWLPPDVARAKLKALVLGARLAGDG